MQISYIDFVHLRQSDLGRMKVMVSEGKVEEILTAFTEWLVMWKDDAWIDYEKIEANILYLRHVGVWTEVPFSDFLVRSKSRLCNEVAAVMESIATT